MQNFTANTEPEQAVEPEATAPRSVAPGSADTPSALDCAPGAIATATAPAAHAVTPAAHASPVVYTASTEPDSFTGAIFAIEGIADAAVVLNGPTGCKFYHSAISDTQFPRAVDYDPLSFSERCFFGQPRVPATYLDGDDYIFGSAPKLEEVLEVVDSKGYSLIAVINSPGAALIGDDLDRLLGDSVSSTRHLSIESTGFSGDYGSGFQTAINKVIDLLDLPETEVRPKSVNLLGINLDQKYYDNNYYTLRELLALCEIEVITAFGATDTLDKITLARQAALNVVVCPETGLDTARKLYSDWGTPYIVAESGQPIGFEAIVAFVTQITEALGADASGAHETVDKARARAYLQLSRYSSLLGLPKGAFYSIRAAASIAYPLARWLSSYLGMIPAAIEILSGEDGGFSERLRAYMASLQLEDVLSRPVATTPTQVVFADGDTIATCKLMGLQTCGIEIGFPSLNYLDITRKQLYGPEGTLFLLEQVMNGLRYV
ncbi:MAG: oxidoreductase [Coriobacteriia bacterium]|nr:oxidoreductase [Coriobacteriia bacterium]